MTEEKEAPSAPQPAAEDAAPPTKTASPEAPAAKAASAETGPAGTGPAGTGPAETGPAETGPPEEVVSVPDELPTDGAEEKPRRVRARRAVAKPPQPRDGDKPRRPRERRGDRRGGDRRGRGRKKGEEVTAVGAAPMRRAGVYTQDPVDGPPGPPPPPEPTPAELKAKKAKDQTKTTLILHPAPKAGGHVKKKKKAPKTAKEALAAKTKGKGKGPKGKEKTPQKDAKLDANWIEAGADGAVEALQTAGPAAEQLVQAWMDDDNLAAIATGAASEELSGKPRKAVRRAATILRSRGVELPEVAVAASAVQPETPDEPVATFVPPDATGTMFISISQRQPGGRYLVADCVARHGVGVIRASQGRLAGKQIRAWKDRIEKDYGAAPVEIPLDWARARIEEAKETNAKSGAIMPLGFDSCAELFQPTPEEAPPHPVEDLTEADPGKETLEKAAADSERLHSFPEFRSWMPDRNSIDELLAKVGETVGSEEAASDSEKVNEALKNEVAAATDRFFTPELRTAVAAWMKDAAICVRARTGEDDEARHVLRVATAVEQAGLITSPPNEIPFLQTFFQKAIAYVVSQNQGQLRVPVPGAQPQL